MKIIRWFLSHIFLFLLIVIVIYGYMFWGNLAGDDTPAGKAIAYLSGEFEEVEEFVNAVKAKQADLAEKPSAEEKELASATSDVSTESEQAVPVGSDLREIEQNPVNISYSHNQQQVNQDSTGRVAVVQNTEKSALSLSESKPAPQPESDIQALTKEQSNPPEIEAKLKSAESAETKVEAEDVNFVSEDIEKQLDNVDEHGHIVDAALQSAEIRALWIAARKAYYQRDYQASVKNYIQVIDKTNDNFDAYGELGNVYFNQGKKSEAAAAYYEAASIFVRKGQLVRARSLIGLLRNLDRAKAEELQNMIASAKS